MIDEEEGEQPKDNWSHQSKPSKVSQESRKILSDVSEQMADGKPSGASFECQAGSGEQRNNAFLSIPSFHDLKEQSPSTKSSPLKLKKSQEAKRPGYKEKDDTKTVFISSAAAPVYVDAREPTDNTGM